MYEIKCLNRNFPKYQRSVSGGVLPFFSANGSCQLGRLSYGKYSRRSQIGITISFWFDAAQAVGGYIGTLATAVASPYFNVALTVCAVAWLLWAGEPKKGVLRDPRWSYLAWTIVGIVGVTLAIIAGYGYFEIKVLEAVATRPLLIEARHITEMEKACLSAELPPSHRKQETLSLGNHG